MLKRNNSNSSLALAWLVVVMIFSGLLIKQFAFSSSVPIESNILKLLPENQQDPMVEQAFQQISSSMSEQVVFIISASDVEQAMTATDAFEKNLTKGLSQISQLCLRKFKAKSTQAHKASGAISIFVTELNC